MAKWAREAEPFGKDQHVLLEVVDKGFTVCIDITGTEAKSKSIADALQKCLKTLLKEKE